MSRKCSVCGGSVGKSASICSSCTGEWNGYNTPPHRMAKIFNDTVYYNEDYVNSLKAQIELLEKAIDFYGDKSNWHYGKMWSENDVERDKAVLFHAINSTVYPDKLDIDLNKIDSIAFPLESCDVELMPDKVDLLNKKYSYYCSGKLARETKRKLEELRRGNE